MEIEVPVAGLLVVFEAQFSSFAFSVAADYNDSFLQCQPRLDVKYS